MSETPEAMEGYFEGFFEVQIDGGKRVRKRRKLISGKT